MINRFGAIWVTLCLALWLGLSSVAIAQEFFLGEMRLRVEMSVEAADGTTSQFALFYRGNGATGDASMTMTDADGSVLSDDATGCGLTVGGSRWTLVCNNPHFVTWDSVYYDFHIGPELSLSGDLLTGGRQTFMPIVSPVRVVAQYESRSATAAR